MIVFALGTSYVIYRKASHSSVIVDKRIETVNLDGISKLMIVSHPVDDYIWGGAHLINDDYLVVCITCGVTRNRVIEFRKAMNKTNDRYIMLGYPDTKDGQIDNWDSVYSDIYSDLKKIIEYKDWKEIITHNPDGEYGHIQHKMTSKIVSDIANKDILYYFGKYYSNNEIPLDLTKISDEDYKVKVEELIPIYKSQQSTMDKLSHMFGYENWVKYNEWKN
jgi:hypothetical protein